MKILPYGDGALFVDLELGDRADRQSRTQAVGRALRRHLPGADIVLGAGTLAIVGVGAWDDLDGVVAGAMARPTPADDADTFAPKRHELRAVYDGPDLDDVARRSGMARAEVVALHASREYRVDLLGFLPGFAYLAGLDPRLHLARRASPRPRVPHGALAIAGPYTGIYPGVSPGGWHLIGRVIDIVPFGPARHPPSLFEPGDTVHFVPLRPD